MSGISKALRFRILARDGFKCRYCGASAPSVELRVDHIIPRAGGGRNQETNLVTACADCNAGKSDRQLTGLTKPLVGVEDRRGRKPKAADPKNRGAQYVRKGEPNHHILNTGMVLETREKTGDDVSVYLWCVSHQTYEWHLIKPWMIGGSGGVLERRTEAMSASG